MPREVFCLAMRCGLGFAARESLGSCEGDVSGNIVRGLQSGGACWRPGRAVGRDLIGIYGLRSMVRLRQIVGMASDDFVRRFLAIERNTRV